MKFIIVNAVIAMTLLVTKVHCNIDIEGIDEVISLLENITESSSMLLSEMTTARVDNRNTMAMVGQGQSQMAATLVRVATIMERQSQNLQNIESDMNTVVSVLETQQETLVNISGLLSVIADQQATLIEMQHPQIPTTTAIPEAGDAPLVDDCSELDGYPSGIYTINPSVDLTFNVYCYMEDNDDYGSGWTVFQRRLDGSTNFYRNWTDYKNGFGSLNGEFWMGLQPLHLLTNNGKSYDLLILLEDFNNTTAYVRYESFSIGSESSNYTLNVGGSSGTAGGSSLSELNGHPFSTCDRDNDGNDCPVDNQGAWWYNGCSSSNLNGRYNPEDDPYHGIYWYDWKYNVDSLKSTYMMVQPRNLDRSPGHI